MVDRASVWQLEEGMGFIHLLQVCLQESSCYNTPKHGESGFRKAIAGAGSVREDSVNLRMVVDLEIPSLQADPYDDNGSETKKVLTHSRSLVCCFFPITTFLKFMRGRWPSNRKSRPPKSTETWLRTWTDFQRVRPDQIACVSRKLRR